MSREKLKLYRIFKEQSKDRVVCLLQKSKKHNKKKGKEDEKVLVDLVQQPSG